jgi:hypothetical protein
MNPLMPTVNQLFDKVRAIPGIRELLKRTIVALRVSGIEGHLSPAGAGRLTCENP